jgi:glycosyltransferase involved in cell wall biosynthesis
MKLIIQIPCFNEEATLPLTLADLPRAIPGIESVEVLVIDDGSTDRTVAVARQLGVDYIVRHIGNKGLARAFQTGLDTCLKLGADIIVNTDGDNQYPGGQIPQLIAPILARQADMVIGDRQTHAIEHFSPVKKVLQAAGSMTVRFVSDTEVPDAPSGFRAFSREAALRLNVLSQYTYTLETIVQAGKKKLAIAFVPIQTGAKTRESRLIGSTWSYVRRSGATLLRLYALYEPLKTFFYVSLPFILMGSGAIVRFLYLYFTEQSGIGRHVQSVMIGGTLLTLGFLILLFGILADLVALNRHLLEENLYQMKLLRSQSRPPEVERVRPTEGGEVKLSPPAPPKGGERSEISPLGGPGGPEPAIHLTPLPTEGGED